MLKPEAWSLEPIPMVSVLITTYNSAAHLEACLDSLRRQTYRPLDIIIVDNASTDGTRTILNKIRSECHVIFNDKNLGFAAGQNQAIRAARGQWLLSLNPDVIAAPDFIEKLVAIGEMHPEAGAVCGKLLRWNPAATPPLTNMIDSTGIYFTPSLRHLDRGADEMDRDQFSEPQFVFGATGAAALYRTYMVEDISVNGQFFDEQFFAYREDADVAWRAQLLGWKCVYTPDAVAWHVRRVTPERRSELPLVINWHSVKNRFLMRAKNISWRLYARTFLPTTIRDAQVIGYSLLWDRRLASALAHVWKTRREWLAKRRAIQARRRVPDAELSHWFSRCPVAISIGRSKGGAIAA
jgi:GT2 family glycosyltransferase